ncbi:hypothetical protein S100390_v1c04590 [Spiroplasma sp. NBRC 100390]|uniref:hypothetical protein n=1 Tax=unclassified Spiroplasma TaxID=2637901 RepID=UPI0008929DEC|nr:MULTISPECIES: hypothetical protein [unclassified Spiroplasma]AOX43802.1 hypothetical protein STU14_v1c04590 [Spiroplasma sp. TU-14]APE13272.1 hypothetical protein S100390_v1c04590 [Spiroplasma sp. NBRC 100390]
MAKKKNIFKQLHELKQEQKKTHQKEVAEIVDDTYQNHTLKLETYQKLKRITWFHCLIAVLISAIIVGFSFLLGVFAFKDIKKTEWIVVSFLVIILLIWFILGWYKNKTAAAYFNDHRRRYQPTLTDDEANIKKIRNILLIIAAILLISSLIIFFTV